MARGGWGSVGNGTRVGAFFRVDGPSFDRFCGRRIVSSNFGADFAKKDVNCVVFECQIPTRAISHSIKVQVEGMKNNTPKNRLSKNYTI